MIAVHPGGGRFFPGTALNYTAHAPLTLAFAIFALV